MQEIILISLFNLVAAAALMIAAVKMYSVVIKKKDKISLTYFFYGLLFISLYLFIKGLPGIVLTDGLLVHASATLFRPLLLIGGMFFFLIPFNLLKLKIVEKVYVVFTILMIAAAGFLSFLGLRGKEVIYRDTEYWIIMKDPFLEYSALLVGTVFSLSLLTAAGLYLYFAYQKREREVAFGRAVMIAMACLLFFIAGVTENIVGPFVENFLAVGTITSILYIMGGVALVASVNYKGEKGKNKSN